jgi:hypothetical protein
LFWLVLSAITIASVMDIPMHHAAPGERVMLVWIVMVMVLVINVTIGLIVKINMTV